MTVQHSKLYVLKLPRSYLCSFNFVCILSALWLQNTIHVHEKKIIKTYTQTSSLLVECSCDILMHCHQFRKIKFPISGGLRALALSNRSMDTCFSFANFFISFLLYIFSIKRIRSQITTTIAANNEKKYRWKC